MNISIPPAELENLVQKYVTHELDDDETGRLLEFLEREPGTIDLLYEQLLLDDLLRDASQFDPLVFLNRPITKKNVERHGIDTLIPSEAAPFFLKNPHRLSLHPMKRRHVVRAASCFGGTNDRVRSRNHSCRPACVTFPFGFSRFLCWFVLFTEVISN